ncbi:hypothetical protein BC834DRAFT_590323 [Gloeopeniophorella convolvens]|nr:hypothetical protein BC834DRAFT_590323 [Gloeopeniophorella convolvens]
MFLQTLGRLRAKASTSTTSGDSGYGAGRESMRSNETTNSSIASSPASSKRYSNNMFGSGKFRDYSYMRSVNQQRGAVRGSAGGRSANSTLSSASSRSYKTSDAPIPEDPPQPDPSDPSAHESDTTPLASAVESASELEQGIVKTFQRGHLRRASMALEEVIREIEEADGDGDDKILIPRSPAPQRAASLKRKTFDKFHPPQSSEQAAYEMGTAVSPDYQLPTDAAGSRSTPSPYPRSEASPTPRLPGYIPGMPRPMTPRETTFDSDEISPSSASTPRATSPRIPSTDRGSPVPPLNISSSVLRRDSTSTRQIPRASSPLSASASAPIATLLSSANGRFTPDRSRTPDDPFVEFGNPLDSSILGRRRPVSPLSPSTFQSMTVSSRPSTPSNVTWKSPSTPGNGSAGGHSRSGSAVDFAETDFPPSGLPLQARNGAGGHSKHTRNDSVVSSNDLHDVAQFDRSGSALGTRSLRSPALPDSPVLENPAHSIGSLSSPRRGHTPQSSNDFGSSASSSRVLRSPTPTQYAPRSPASATFSENDVGRNSRRGSRQATASPFVLNQSQGLILSPIANSSRSSIESAGSSYHTWEADKQDRTVPLFTALEPQPPAWHEIPSFNGELSVPSNGVAEEIVQQHLGLSKGDFVVIQDKLLFAAKLKAEAPEPRERRNSLRKRRPSTSQSVSGRDSRAADPIPHNSPQRTAPQDNVIKASALLDSVVDSIQAPELKFSDVSGDFTLDVNAFAGPSVDPEVSSQARRKNALARALFGASDSERSLTSPSPQPAESPPSPRADARDLLTERPPPMEQSSSSRSLRDMFSPSSPSVNAVGLTPSSSGTGTHSDQQELAKEVQRRAEAAMAQLKKMPSNPKIADGNPRKRIDPSRISGPKLVSASTSVDTIPVRSPSAASGQLPATQVQTQSPNSSKFGSRFKKLRGTLRSKPTLPVGDALTPYPLDLASPASADRYDSAFTSPSDIQLPFSAIEPSRSKVVVSTPPASAGPGLKGFVSRFLKQRSGDAPPPERRHQPLLPSSSASTSPSYFAQQQSEHHLQSSHTHQAARSAPPESKSFRPHTPVSPESPPHNPPTSAPVVAPAPNTDPSKAVDDNALRQFMNAGNELGLDPGILSEFLARSASLNSRLTVQGSSKHTSAASSDRYGKALNDLAPLSPTVSTARQSIEQSSPRPSGEAVRKPSIRRPFARNIATPDSARAAVVRRTLIFPSEAKQSTLEPGTSLRKSSSTRRRRSASAASVHSNRSLHDRVPTPPPPKSPASRRFSAEQTPPMPHIPTSLLSQTEAINNTPLSAPVIPLEKSNSAYDSLYEMYTGDGKPAISVTSDVQTPDASAPTNANALHNLEPGAAVEVLELANGETIWSIVNGLRDDDEESFYGNRASFVSEYSLRDEGVQVFFKEHNRTGSKDSQASFLSRRKTLQNPKRPETKVFFSSSAMIGRLIDNLSSGAEAGSFNILPTAQNPPSVHSDSSAHWTVEERLEHMLGTIETSS